MAATPPNETATASPLRFVVHEHAARSHHFDLRLERDGVLKSWAVPKGLPESPGIKRLAIQREDHPLGYVRFSGRIPEGSYGAGEVSIWDEGSYQPRSWTRHAIVVTLHGRRLAGTYALVKLERAGPATWLVFRKGSGAGHRMRRSAGVLQSKPAMP